MIGASSQKSLYAWGDAIKVAIYHHAEEAGGSVPESMFLTETGKDAEQHVVEKRQTGSNRRKTKDDFMPTPISKSPKIEPSSPRSKNKDDNAGKSRPAGKW